jgi:hypothetical protein
MSDMSRVDRIAQQTMLRHALLDNGYAPFPCAGKDGQMMGWPQIAATHALIDEWADQMRWVSTAIRVGHGGVVMLDFDIDDAEAMDAIVDTMPDDLWAVLKGCPIRRGGGVKEAWLSRLAEGETPHYVTMSGAFAKPGEDPDADGVVLHKLEVFAKPRVFLAYGAHTIKDGLVTREYSWVDGRGPATVPLSTLPVLTDDMILRLTQHVSMTLEKLGWVHHLRSRAGRVEPSVQYDLTEDMLFETRGYGAVDLAGLEDMAARVDGLRCSYSFAGGASFANTTRCLVRINSVDGRISVYETGQCVHHRPADMAVRSKLDTLGARLVARGLVSPQGGAGPEMDVASYVEEWVPDGLDEPEAANADEEDPIWVNGGQIAFAARETANRMSDLPVFYAFGGQPAFVGDGGGHIEVMTASRMAHELGLRFRYVQSGRKKDSVVQVDPPMSLVLQVMSLGETLGLRRLAGIVDTPVLRLDGSVARADGYDAATGLLVRGGGLGEYVPETPTADDVREAFDLLWSPFRHFPFVDNFARGGMLAALLTAAVRRVLPTSPAFAFDAPSQGSGKTLLAQCVGALAGGAKLMSPLPFRDEIEVAKVVLSVLMEAPRAVIFDNQIGSVDSASLASVLTAPEYGGRILGTSMTARVPTNLVVMLTGNNVALGGDMPRRVVRIRIDAGVETPFDRHFDFDPLAVVTARREEMCVAALILMKAAWASSVGGRIGSFEAWDQMVGQAVRWVGAEGGVGAGIGFADPRDVILAGHGQDVAREELVDLLAVLRSQFGNRAFTARDVHDVMSGQSAGAMRLRDALEGTAGARRALTTRGIGVTLQYRVGQRVGGLWLEIERDRAMNTSRFCVRSAADGDDGVVEGDFGRARAAAAGKVAHLRAGKS